MCTAHCLSATGKSRCRVRRQRMLWPTVPQSFDHEQLINILFRVLEYLSPMYTQYTCLSMHSNYYKVVKLCGRIPSASAPNVPLATARPEFLVNLPNAEGSLHYLYTSMYARKWLCSLYSILFLCFSKNIIVLFTKDEILYK